MRYVIIQFILLFAIFGVLYGQQQESDLRLINQTGNGVKELSLANNVVASTGDCSSLFWNPSALGFLSSREIQFSMDAASSRVNSDFFDQTTTSSTNRLRLTTGGFLFSLPVTRGGFSFALAFQNPISFDDCSVYEGTYYKNAVINVDNFYKTSGGLHFWTAGFGLQIAQNFSAGVALSLIKGAEKTTNSLYISSNITNSYGQPAIDTIVSSGYHIETDYTGFDARAGLTYKNDLLSAGLRFCAPQIIKFTEREDGYTGSAKGHLYSSYQGAGGVAVKLPFMLITTEVRSTLPFTFVFQDDDIPQSSQAAHFKSGGGIGLEVPIPATSFLVRAGYSYDEVDLHYYAVSPDNEKKDWFDSDVSTSDKQMISCGFAIMSSVTSFDLSYAATFWSMTTRRNLKQDFLQHRVAASLSFRY